MAINTQKLLPGVKTTAITKAVGINIKPSVSIKSKRVDISKFIGPRAKDTTVGGELLVTKEKLLKIDGLLKNILDTQRKEDKSDKKEKQNIERDKREKNLESGLKLPPIKGFKPNIPGMGIIDRIKRFVFFTFLGWLFTKFEKDLPKLQGIFGVIGNVLQVSENIFGGILNGLVSFIDAGYKAYDTVRKFSKDVGGEKLQKTFDDFSTNLNVVLNAILTLGASLLVKPAQVPQKKDGGLVSKMENGGKSTPTSSSTRAGKTIGGAVKRTVQIQPKKPQKIKPQQSQPGKDVGGQKKIEILYPNPKQTETNRKPSPYKALTETSKKLKEIPFVGALMGAAVDVALGQKPDPKVYNSIGNGIGYLVQSLADQKVSSSMGSLTRAIIGMADGGTVPTLAMVGGQGEMINRVLGILIQSRVNEALQSVRQEVNKQKDSGVGEGGSLGGGELSGGAGGYAEGEKNFVSSKEVYGYLRSKGVSHIHAMGMLANIQAESSFNAGAIGDNGTSGGLFQHHAERFDAMRRVAGKNWSNNWKGQIDYALSEGSTKQYLQKDFKNQSDASAWFTINWERPSDATSKARQRLENLNNFNVDGSWKGSTSSVQPGKSKVSTDIEAFRQFRNKQFGASSQRTPSAQGQFYQIRELGVYGSGDYKISPLADDVSYEIEEHKGAGHKENRAFDIPVPPSSKEGDRVADYWRSRGYTVIWRSEGHYDHVHVEVPKEKASEFFKVIKSKPKPPAQKPKPKPKAQPTQSASGGFFQNLNPFNWFKPKPTSQSKVVAPAKQGGGYIGKAQSRDISSIQTYPSYDGSNGMMIAIQPMIIEKPVPVPSGKNRSIMFPIPVGVNNSSMQSLSRG